MVWQTVRSRMAEGNARQGKARQDKGPVQFILYSEDITAVFDKRGIKCHQLFADDKQLLTSVTVTDVSVAKSNTEACVADVQACISPIAAQPV